MPVPMKKRSALLVAAVALVLSVLAPSIAMACMCMPLTKPSYAHQATLVFTGTVTGVDVHSSPPVYSSIDPVDVTFDVETVYKGAVTRTFQVVTVAGDASCGYRFIVGRRYTVFPWHVDEKLHAGLCTGTIEGAINAAEYLLPSGYEPGTDPPLTGRALIVAAAVLATFVIVGLERLRTSRQH